MTAYLPLSPPALEIQNPSHLLMIIGYTWRRITYLPYTRLQLYSVENNELTDLSYRETGEVAIYTEKPRCKRLYLLRFFQKRWLHEYLASLRDYHKISTGCEEK